MYVPQGLPLIVQPVLVEPRAISWLDDIEDFIETAAFTG